MREPDFQTLVDVYTEFKKQLQIANSHQFAKHLFIIRAENIEEDINLLRKHHNLFRYTGIFIEDEIEKYLFYIFKLREILTDSIKFVVVYSSFFRTDVKKKFLLLNQIGLPVFALPESESLNLYSFLKGFSTWLEIGRVQVYPYITYYCDFLCRVLGIERKMEHFPFLYRLSSLFYRNLWNLKSRSLHFLLARIDVRNMLSQLTSWLNYNKPATVSKNLFSDLNLSVTPDRVGPLYLKRGISCISIEDLSESEITFGGVVKIVFNNKKQSLENLNIDRVKVSLFCTSLILLSFDVVDCETVRFVRNFKEKMKGYPLALHLPEDVLITDNFEILRSLKLPVYLKVNDRTKLDGYIKNSNYLNFEPGIEPVRELFIAMKMKESGIEETSFLLKNLYPEIHSVLR